MIENHGLPGPAGAEISDCGRYRYMLWRIWDETLPLLGYVMLNPSTADHRIDDPTITRCCERARRRGAGGILVANLYGWRSTNPKRMFEDAADPVGPGNDSHVLMVGKLCPNIILAWGENAENARQILVVEMLKALSSKPKLLHLGKTKRGRPRHPLYIPYDFTPQEWT